jgi:hypothetical protein
MDRRDFSEKELGEIVVVGLSYAWSKDRAAVPL